jgi:hypothetical protein
MSTTFAPSAFAELDKIKTPNFDAAAAWNYQDADDELRLIAKFLASKASHESEIDPSRIKFFYTTKVKKDGGKFILGTLSAIDELQRMINDQYDYILCIYYPVWKDLDSKNKAIQLDKILCGVQLAPGKDQAEVVVKKKATDVREYEENMKHFGELEVMKSSEIVNLAVTRILEEEAEQKKIKKEQNQAKKKKKTNE